MVCLSNSNAEKKICRVKLIPWNLGIWDQSFKDIFPISQHSLWSFLSGTCPFFRLGLFCLGLFRLGLFPPELFPLNLFPLELFPLGLSFRYFPLWNFCPMDYLFPDRLFQGLLLQGHISIEFFSRVIFSTGLFSFETFPLELFPLRLFQQQKKAIWIALVGLLVDVDFNFWARTLKFWILKVLKRCPNISSLWFFHLLNEKSSYLVKRVLSKGAFVLCTGIWYWNLQFWPKWLSEGVYRSEIWCQFQWWTLSKWKNHREEMFEHLLSTFIIQNFRKKTRQKTRSW